MLFVTGCGGPSDNINKVYVSKDKKETIAFYSNGDAKYLKGYELIVGKWLYDNSTIQIHKEVNGIKQPWLFLDTNSDGFSVIGELSHNKMNPFIYDEMTLEQFDSKVEKEINKYSGEYCPVMIVKSDGEVKKKFSSEEQMNGARNFDFEKMEISPKSKKEVVTKFKRISESEIEITEGADEHIGSVLKFDGDNLTFTVKGDELKLIRKDVILKEIAAAKAEQDKLQKEFSDKIKGNWVLDSVNFSNLETGESEVKKTEGKYNFVIKEKSADGERLKNMDYDLNEIEKYSLTYKVVEKINDNEYLLETRENGKDKDDNYMIKMIDSSKFEIGDDFRNRKEGKAPLDIRFILKRS